MPDLMIIFQPRSLSVSLSPLAGSDPAPTPIGPVYPAPANGLSSID
jgi:hypothetical protein